LARDVEVLELTDNSRGGVDAVMTLSANGVGPVRIAEAVAALPDLVAGARAIRIARRCRDLLGAAAASLDDNLARNEAAFDARLAKLAVLRVTDPAAFVAEQIARMRPQIVTSVHAVMEHASAHLDSELGQLAAAWEGGLAKATSSDELKAAVSAIDATAVGSLQRIADEVGLLVVGGLGGCARDLYPAVMVAPIQQVPARESPVLRAVTVLPSLRTPTASKLAASWLSGLFQSFEARRAAASERASERVDHLRAVASAEIMDAEPQLYTTLGDALATELAAALDRHHAALDDSIAKEHAAIARDRKKLAPLARLRDDVHDDMRRLSETLERQPPAVVAAAAR
jgi:hypothetical protein